ncbi:MAG TPA: amino acid ABC transporter substrate-binding protein [Burkholderiaceae bacterium]
MMKTLTVAATLLAAAVSAHAQTTDTLKKIKDTGTIVMGVRGSSGALSYTLGNGQYVGFHVELCQRAIDDIGKQLGKKIEVKYQEVTSANRIPLVQNGTVDIECGSTTNNEAREKDVAFAHTAYVEEVRILTKTNSGVKDIKDLNGKTVATTTGTTSVQLLRKNERATGIDFKEVFGKDHADSFQLLESGRADAFVMDGQIVMGLASKSKNPADFHTVGPALSVEPIAIMVRKDDPAFLAAVNKTLDGLMKSGEMAKIYDKWFMQPIPPTNTKVGLPASEYTKAAWANPNSNPTEWYVAHAK